EAYARGSDVPLPQSRPYADYLEWLLRQDMERAESFWREVLQGISEPTPLGIDRTIGADVAGAQYDERTLHLTRESGAGLQAFALVQRWSGVPSGKPLFESIVVFDNYPFDESLKHGAKGLAIDDVDTTERTNYPIHVVASFADTLSMLIRYDRRRVDDAAVERM